MEVCPQASAGDTGGYGGIHEENMARLSAMSEQEILTEQQKLLQTLGVYIFKVISALLNCAFLIVLPGNMSCLLW